MQSTQHLQHPASVDLYIRHGWYLVPVPKGTKGPNTKGWNKKKNMLTAQSQLPEGYGIGLAHAYSGTMALDIDNWDRATELLESHGINLQELYDASDAVIIDSGRKGRGKLLFQMPDDTILPTKKITEGNEVIYELRCASNNGLTVQDILPPSIHPETNEPYRWAGKGNWQSLPPLPDSLLTHWQDIIDSQYQELASDTPTSITTSWHEIYSAVDAIDPSTSREEWITVGMALHWAATVDDKLNEALIYWNDWSKDSDKYPGTQQVWSQWCSFKSDKANNRKLGSLFHIAKKHGWERPVPPVSHMFGATPIDPDTVIKDYQISPPDVDMSHVPNLLRTRALEISEHIGCDPLVPLFAGFSAVCAAADARHRLELLPGFTVPPVLWFMTVGDPADKKTPGSRPMFKFLSTLEKEDLPRFRDEMLVYEGLELRYAKAKKEHNDFYESEDSALPNTVAPNVPEMPVQPSKLRLVVQDITSQKLVNVAAPRPYGLLCHMDEMHSWFEVLTTKKNTENRSTWTKSYEADSASLDRMGSGETYCENFAVSIYGNIQPRSLKLYLNDLSNDGFLQRFIPAFLRKGFTKVGNPVAEDKTSVKHWEDALRKIRQLEPRTYQLSHDAYDLFRQFQHAYESRKENYRTLNVSDEFMTAYGKSEGTLGRITLIFHLLTDPLSTSVTRDTLTKAINFFETYVLKSLRVMFDSSIGEDSLNVTVMNYVINHSDKKIIRVADIKRNHHRKFVKFDKREVYEMILITLEDLVTKNWLYRVDDDLRADYAKFAVNPDLINSFRQYRAKLAEARQNDLHSRIYVDSPKPKPDARNSHLL